MRGEQVALQNLIKARDALLCRSASCPIPTFPIRLTLSAPHLPSTQIILEEATVANPIQEAPGLASAGDAVHVVPSILLRGHVAVRRDWSSLTHPVPVAAALVRNEGVYTLEVAMPERPPRVGHDDRGTIVVRVPLDNLTSRERFNARVQAPSRFAFSKKSCSSVTTPAGTVNSLNSSRATPVRSQEVYNVLYIGTDYDSQFAAAARCTSISSCRTKIVTIIHRAAVFYQDQLGYTLEVARQFGPTNFGRTTASEKLLDSFQQYNYENRFDVMNTGSNSNDNQIDLFQLFTGRTMDGGTIGVAYVGTACENAQSRFADLVIQRVSDTLDPITSAHEIGHTLGAEHTQTGIMRPNLGQTPPTSFASSSLLAISNHLNQWYGECREGTSEGVPAATPTPSVNSNPFRGKPTTLTLTIASDAPKKLTISAAISSNVPECPVKVHAAPTSSAAPRGLVISESIPSELTTSLTADVLFRIDQKGSKDRTIYFVAERTCSDGTIVEVSRILKFDTNKIRGLRGPGKSKRAWIGALRATPKQQSHF